MKGADSLYICPSGLSTETPVYFVEVFYRLFKIGIYYPLGHVVLDQAVGKLIQQLRETFPTHSTIRLEVENHLLLLERQELPMEVASVRNLHALLAGLCIGEFLIERAISHKQLLHFVRTLLAWRVRLKDTSSFIPLNTADLPDSIMARQQVNAAEKWAEIVAANDARSLQKIQEMCAVLSHQDFNVNHLQQCRSLLLNLAEKDKRQRITFRGFPNATWQDVQNLLHASILGASLFGSRESVEKAVRDVHALAGIFTSLSENCDDAGEKNILNLMLDHLSRTVNRGSFLENVHRETRGYGKEEQSGIEISGSALQTFVVENRAAFTATTLLTSDSGAILSIIFQLLQRNENKKIPSICRHKLATIVVGPLSAREWSVLLAGFIHLADLEHPHRFHGLLELVLYNLRGSSHCTSCEFLVRLWNETPKTLHSLLWPYAVNELMIVGMAAEKKYFYELTEIVCHVHPQIMRKLCPAVEALDAFRDKIVAPIIFRSSYIYAYPFFAFLIDTSLGSMIAEKVLAELQKDPQDEFMAAIGPILQLSDQSHYQLLKSYLNYAQNVALPLSLKAEAGQIILNYLENINAEQKELAWLDKTIRALAELQVEGTRDFLERISNEKKFAVVPSWNRQCRKAAEDALQFIANRTTS